MTVSAHFEMMSFFVSIITAGVIGINFDFFRALSKNGKKAIWDVIMWSVSLAIVIFVWFHIFFGRLRRYMFVAVILGMVLYFFLFSKYVFLIIDFLLTKIRVIFSFILKILLTPLSFLCKIISVYIKGVRSKFSKKVEEKHDEKKA